MKSQKREVIRYGDLVIDKSFRYRDAKPEHVDRYFEVLRTGGSLPSITYMVRDGKKILIGGLHRTEAYVKFGLASKDIGGLGMSKADDILIPASSLGKWDEEQAYIEVLKSDMSSGLPPTKEERNKHILVLYTKFGGTNIDEENRLTQEKLSSMFHIHQSNISRIVKPESAATKTEKKKKQVLKKKQADAVKTGAKLPVNNEVGKDVANVTPPTAQDATKNVFSLFFHVVTTLTVKENRQRILDHLQKYRGDNDNLPLAIKSLTELAINSKAIQTPVSSGKVVETKRNGKSKTVTAK